MFISIWVKLLQQSSDGLSFDDLNIGLIEGLKNNAMVEHLRKELTKDTSPFHNKLAGIDSSDLKVYSRLDENGKPTEVIEEDEPLSDLLKANKGNRKKNVLIVVAPPKPGK